MKKLGLSEIGDRTMISVEHCEQLSGREGNRAPKV